MGLNLNTIPNTGKFQAVVDRMNDNTAKLTSKITELDNATTKFKGYFSTLTFLQNKVPSPLEGDTAWVGATYPGTVYDVVDGEWHDTTVAPVVEGADLSEYVSKDERMILNVDTDYPLGSGNYTLSSAIAAIPTVLHKTGLTIQFKDADGKLVSYLFNGIVANFGNVINWELKTSRQELSNIGCFGKYGEVYQGSFLVSGTNWLYVKVFVQEGDVINSHSIIPNVDDAAIAFFNATDNYISGVNGDGTANYNDYQATAPANASYALIMTTVPGLSESYYYIGNETSIIDRVSILENQTLNAMIVDLPVSDGTDIESGYAYIDSVSNTIKVKP